MSRVCLLKRRYLRRDCRATVLARNAICPRSSARSDSLVRHRRSSIPSGVLVFGSAIGLRPLHFRRDVRGACGLRLYPLSIRELRGEHRCPTSGLVASSILLLPIAPQMLRLFSSRHDHVYTPSPDIQALLLGLVRPFPIGAIGLGLLFLLAIRRHSTIEWNVHFSTAWFLAAWTLIPIAMVFFVSCFSGTKMFIDRYYFSSTPALALLGVRWLPPSNQGPRNASLRESWRFARSQFGAIGTFARETPDWRGASLAEREHVGNAQTPVMVISSFVEAKEPASFSDPDSGGRAHRSADQISGGWPRDSIATDPQSRYREIP